MRTTKPFKPNHYKTFKQMLVEIFKPLVQNSIFQIPIQTFKNQNSNLYIFQISNQDSNFRRFPKMLELALRVERL